MPGGGFETTRELGGCVSVRLKIKRGCRLWFVGMGELRGVCGLGAWVVVVLKYLLDNGNLRGMAEVLRGPVSVCVCACC